MRTILVTSIFIFSFIFPTKLAAQSADKTLLTITIYESCLKDYNKILVFENEKKLEEVPLYKFHIDFLDLNNAETNKVLVKYRKQGYQKISEVRGGLMVTGGIIVMATTYMFEK